jgi:hypothetical protein
MINTEDIVKLTEPGEKESAFRLGTVSALFAHGTAKILFDGEEEASEKEYAYLSNYVPELNDRVLLAKTGGSYVIIGALSYAVAPDDGGGATQSYLFDAEEVTMTKGLDLTGLLKARTGATVTGAMAASGKVSGSSLETPGAASVGGNLSVDGSLSVDGGGTMGGDYTHSGKVTFNGGIDASTVNWNYLPYLRVDGHFAHRGSAIGFFNKSPVTRPSGTAYNALYSSATLSQVIDKVNLYINLLKSYGLAP